MRKYAGLIILVLSAVIFVALAGYDSNAAVYSKCIIDKAYYNKLKDERTEYEGLVKGLVFDEQELFYEPNARTFYYSLVEGSSSAYNPQVRAISDEDDVRLAFLEEPITDEGIEQNQSIRVLVYSLSCYYEYYLKCTTLPLMNVAVGGAIERAEMPMTMTLFDNQKGAANRVTTSAGTIKVRGASSSRLPKVSYRMSLTTESLGENTRPNHVSLLGMRQDDDWILYTPFNDQEKVRNVFNTNLWTEICGTNNAKGIQTGLEYKYFELFINGDYWGLYALGYPIDSKMMGIDEAEGEILYKKVGWGSETALEGGYNINSGAYINGFEVKTIDKTQKNDIYEKWATLLTFYEQYYQYRHDNEKLLRMIDIDNAIDTYLFLGLIQGHDNTRATEVRNMYIYMSDNDGTLQIIYAPWDMDLTWGNAFSEDWYSNYVNQYYHKPENNLVMTAGPLNQLLLNQVPGVLEKILERYWELRESGWSDEHINELLDAYEADIYGSGMYRRELERWPGTTQINPDDGLKTFREYVRKRFQVLDNYYTQLERDYKNGTYKLALSPDYKFSARPVDCADLKMYLTMLAFSDCDINVEVKSTAIWEDEFYVSLLENAGIRKDMVIVNSDLEYEVHIILTDRKTMEVIDESYFGL